MSACHSEKIGQILHECGIPVVVAVNSDTAIDDGVCILFSRNFYLHLLLGKTVKEAFNEATSICKSKT